MVRIRTLCQGSETLLLALESMTFSSERSEPHSPVPDSPCEAEWAALWPSSRQVRPEPHHSWFEEQARAGIQRLGAGNAETLPQGGVMGQP